MIMKLICVLLITTYTTCKHSLDKSRFNVRNLITPKVLIEYDMNIIKNDDNILIGFRIEQSLWI